jgi:hypothetical protein
MAVRLLASSAADRARLPMKMLLLEMLMLLEYLGHVRYHIPAASLALIGGIYPSEQLALLSQLLACHP